MSKSKSVNQESRIGLSGKSETGFSFFCRLGYYIEHIGKSSQKKKNPSIVGNLFYHKFTIIQNV